MYKARIIWGAIDFMSSTFKPHIMLRGGQLQTIVGSLSSKRTEHQTQQKILVTLSDGDQTYAELDCPRVKNENNDCLVVVFHGLGGSAQAPYLTRLSRKLCSLGFAVARANHRGACDETAHLAKGLYHCGSSNDAMEIVDAVFKAGHYKRLGLVGFSLSGAVILNLVGRNARKKFAWNESLKSVVAVCAPMNLEESSKSLARLRNVHIDLYYSRMLRKKALQLISDHGPSRYPKIPKSFTLRDFDEFFTAPVAGFLSRVDYYNQCSPQNIIDDIDIPTLILQSTDDPVVPKDSIGSTKNPHVCIDVQQGGGHMGFVSQAKTRFGDRRWMDVAIIDWLMKQLN
jgi:predicted alpha/beta-fold hydrolase